MQKCNMFLRTAGMIGILALLTGLTACSGSSSVTGSAAGDSEAGAESGNSGESTENTSGAPGSAENETIKIGVLSIADSFPLYVAEDEGLFADEGLDVETVDFQSASDQSVAYEAGEIDGMMTDMIVESLVNKASAEEGMKTVAMAFGGTKEEGRFLVVSSPDSDIKKPEDLEGTKIGISENTMMEYLVTSYLTDLGVDLDKVEFVNIPKLTLRLDSVIEGNDIQAAILPDPLAIEAAERGCNTVIDDTKLDRNYSQSVVTLSSRIIENEPDTLDHFLAAYNKAIEEIDADPDKYTDLFYEKVNVSEDLRGKYSVPTFTADCVPTEDEVDSIEQWMVSKGLLETAFTYDEIVYKEQDH